MKHIRSVQVDFRECATWFFWIQEWENIENYFKAMTKVYMTPLSIGHAYDLCRHDEIFRSALTCNYKQTKGCLYLVPALAQAHFPAQSIRLLDAQQLLQICTKRTAEFLDICTLAPLRVYIVHYKLLLCISGSWTYTADRDMVELSFIFANVVPKPSINYHPCTQFFYCVCVKKKIPGQMHGMWVRLKQEWYEECKMIHMINNYLTLFSGVFTKLCLCLHECSVRLMD